MRYWKPFIIITIVLSACRLGSNSEVKVKTDFQLQISRFPSVEDTIKQQLGGKLYFSDDQAPTDSITLIESEHYYSNEFGLYSSYKFIVHSKNTLYHKKFENDYFDKVYKSHLIEDKDMPYNYWQKQVELYYTILNSQKNEVNNAQIDNAIKKYTGYWTYLVKYNDRFYLDDEWSWTASFHLSDSIFTRHTMDGLYPSVIQYFKEKANGDLEIKTIDSDDQASTIYKLIDQNLKIYQKDNFYITPAKNIHNFEIIEYANNTGDLI